MTRAGFPPSSVQACTSVDTTVAAASTAHSPTVTPIRIVTPMKVTAQYCKTMGADRWANSLFAKGERAALACVISPVRIPSVTVSSIVMGAVTSKDHPRNRAILSNDQIWKGFRLRSCITTVCDYKTCPRPLLSCSYKFALLSTIPNKCGAVVK